MTLKPSMVIYSTMAKFFDNYTESFQSVSGIGSGVYAYSVVDKNNYPWLVMYTGYDTASISVRFQSVTAASGIYECYDVFGNLISTGSSFSINATPIYIKGINHQSNKTTMVNNFKTAKGAVYSSRTDSATPNLVLSNSVKGQLLAGETVRFRFEAQDRDSGVHCGYPNRIQYSWKLDGADSGYTSYTNNNYAEYASVSAGNYTFHIRAKDEAGNVTEKHFQNGEEL